MVKIEKGVVKVVSGVKIGKCGIQSGWYKVITWQKIIKVVKKFSQI